MSSEEEAVRTVRRALPHASEVAKAVPGRPYPSPAPGVKAWQQVQPAEPEVGNNPPRVKYEDWTGGKKFKAGRWGHLCFPEPDQEKLFCPTCSKFFYKSPTDPRREAEIAESVGAFGGRLTAREEPDDAGVGPVCLTFELADRSRVEEAVGCLLGKGEHVEGVVDHGD